MEKKIVGPTTQEQPASGAVESEVGTTESPSWRMRTGTWVKKLSVETGGIQRVTDEERESDTTHVWNACTFW